MKITVMSTLLQGKQLVEKNLKFLMILWLTNVAFALALTFPIYYLLNRELLHSKLGETLSLGFDYQWFVQFNSLYKDFFQGMPSVIFAVTGIYILIQIFFIGGLIAVMVNPQKNHHVDFFYGGVRYFYRFMKVTLIAFILYYIVLIIVDYLGMLLNYYFENSGGSRLEFVLQAAKYLILVAFIGISNIISDYTKVSLAVRDNHKVFKEIQYVIFFIKRNFNLVVSVFFLVACFVAVGAIIYNFVESFIPKRPIYFLVLAFLVQQVLIIFRLTLKMLFYSTEVVLFNDLSAEVVTTSIEEVKLGV